MSERLGGSVAVRPAVSSFSRPSGGIERGGFSPSFKTSIKPSSSPAIKIAFRIPALSRPASLGKTASVKLDFLKAPIHQPSAVHLDRPVPGNLAFTRTRTLWSAENQSTKADGEQGLLKMPKLQPPTNLNPDKYVPGKVARDFTKPLWQAEKTVPTVKPENQTPDPQTKPEVTKPVPVVQTEAKIDKPAQAIKQAEQPKPVTETKTEIPVTGAKVEEVRKNPILQTLLEKKAGITLSKDGKTLTQPKGSERLKADDSTEVLVNRLVQAAKTKNRPEVKPLTEQPTQVKVHPDIQQAIKTMAQLKSAGIMDEQEAIQTTSQSLQTEVLRNEFMEQIQLQSKTQTESEEKLMESTEEEEVEELVFERDPEADEYRVMTAVAIAKELHERYGEATAKEVAALMPTEPALISEIVKGKRYTDGSLEDFKKYLSSSVANTPTAIYRVARKAAAYFKAVRIRQILTTEPATNTDIRRVLKDRVQAIYTETPVSAQHAP